jgi:plastocyanin
MHRAVVWTFAGALALLLLATPIAVAAGGCVNHGLANDGAAPTIAIKDCAFSPTVTRVPTDATVSWKNVDYLPHVISGIGWGSVNGYASVDASMLQPGSTFAHTFTTPGLYPYACYLHPGMSGVVIVGDTEAAPSSTTESESATGSAVPASANAAPSSDAPWSYLLVALFGIVAIGGYGIALVRRF